MATTKPQKSTRSSEKTDAWVWLYSVLLTLQYGAQPLISKRFTRHIRSFFNQLNMLINMIPFRK
jgi:hypothetical protein